MKTWAEQEFENVKAQWNKEAQTLVDRMSDIPDHGLYAVWMEKHLRDLQWLYIRVCAQAEALKNIKDN